MEQLPIYKKGLQEAFLNFRIPGSQRIRISFGVEGWVFQLTSINQRCEPKNLDDFRKLLGTLHGKMFEFGLLSNSSLGRGDLEKTLRCRSNAEKYDSVGFFLKFALPRFFC